MLFSACLTRPHFLCGQVGFERGIKPRRYTGTLTLRFAVVCLPFGSCNSVYKLHGIFNAVRPLRQMDGSFLRYAQLPFHLPAEQVRSPALRSYC